MKLPLSVRWRQWNEKRSIMAYESLFMGSDKDAIEAFKLKPYTWWWFLLPVAGFVFIYAVPWEYNMARRQRELNERIKRRTDSCPQKD